jgi:hypothetical protein
LLDCLPNGYRRLFRDLHLGFTGFGIPVLHNFASTPHGLIESEHNNAVSAERVISGADGLLDIGTLSAFCGSLGRSRAVDAPADYPAAATSTSPSIS